MDDIRYCEKHDRYFTTDGIVPDAENCDPEADCAKRMIEGFRFYLPHINAMIAQEKNVLASFSEEDRKLLNLQNRADREQGIVIGAQANYAILEHSIRFAIKSLGLKSLVIGHQLYKKSEISEDRMSKVRSLIKQIARDWSHEGAEERNSCYSRIIRGLEENFPNVEQRHGLHVLVPGAGLARFSWELITKGFSVVANEFDLSMISVANFMLNSKLKEKELSIFPYIVDKLNCWSFDDRLTEVLIPDIDMSSSQQRKNTFGFAMGDFSTSFEDENVFDVVATVFFLDTAKNPITYLRIIHRILKPGGIWLNFGPLLYHFADMAEHQMECIELPFDEILSIAEKIGFDIVKKEGPGENPPSFYTRNKKSMMTYSYDCGYFEAVKRA